MHFIKQKLSYRISIKTILFFAGISICLTTFGQIPTGYYDNAQGLTGESLKNALHDIIKGHTEFPYTSSGTDVWDILKEADQDPNNTDNIIGIYSNFSMNAASEFNNGSGWNREHVWAKSRGDFGTSPGAGTDLHHLRAADISTNSARSNRNFDNAPDQYIDQGGVHNGATDSRTSSTEFIWEPRDEVKGDVARMIFYMATRYEGGSGEPDLELTETLLNNTDKSPLHGKMSVLLAWHLADPVSTAEQNRNEIVYGYQNNRNPFIDHPEYVCEIYTCSTGGNSSPVFSSTPITEATEGQNYVYNITTTDADQDAMTISGSTIPSWLSFVDNGSGSATLSGTPASENVGSHDVILEVTDGNDNTSQSFVLTVSGTGGGNLPPEFTSTAITGATENQQYTYAITVTDVDNDAITISGTTVPSWLSLTDNGGGSATLSGTPSSGDIGSHNVAISASDGTESTTQTFNISVSAADGSSDASDLFFSEYIEGSSFNKGLEIANFTNGNVDLSAYSIQKQTNGAGDWGSELALSGTLSKGDVFVIVNTSADDIMLDHADIVTGSGATTFNGNDPMGLFKNGTLIDIIGTFNGGTANFAQNTTLVRSSDIKSPNSTYSEAEWTSHASNTFTFLGAHTFGGSTNEPCDIPTDLSTSNISSTTVTLNWSASSGANDYNIRYKHSNIDSWFDASTSSTQLALTGLSFNTEYEFQVQSVCADASSEFSASTNFTTLTGDCEIATDLSASNITTSGAELSWKMIPEAISFNVEYKEKSNSSWITTSSTTENLSISGLIVGTSYEFQVQTVCANGTATFSDSHDFDTEPVTNFSDLFISEYIEGSSQNKAIEITNVTGNEVNLSSYSLKIQTDGAGDWGSELVLSGVLGDQDVYVIANSSSSSTILEQADLATSASFISFNGNDPIGLFKNDELIDIIGFFGEGGSDFAADKTLIRKPEIIQSSNAYVKAEWNSLPLNNVDDLGQHTYSGGTIPVVTSIPLSDLSTGFSLKLYPSPAKDNINLNIELQTPGKISIVIFDMGGQKIYSGTNKIIRGTHQTSINVSTLLNGLYVLNIYTGLGTSYTQKFAIRR